MKRIGILTAGGDTPPLDDTQPAVDAALEFGAVDKITLAPPSFCNSCEVFVLIDE
jgi:hypothetical protein